MAITKEEHYFHIKHPGISPLRRIPEEKVIFFQNSTVKFINNNPSDIKETHIKGNIIVRRLTYDSVQVQVFNEGKCLTDEKYKGNEIVYAGISIRSRWKTTDISYEWAFDSDKFEKERKMELAERSIKKTKWPM